MSRWVQVARTNDIPTGEGREVVADGQIVALFCVDGQFFAIDGSCPHQAGPLGRGKLNGCVVTCPRHGLRVNVTTGEYEISTPARLACFQVKLEKDLIYVDLDSATM